MGGRSKGGPVQSATPGLPDSQLPALLSGREANVSCLLVCLPPDNDERRGDAQTSKHSLLLPARTMSFSDEGWRRGWSVWGGGGCGSRFSVCLRTERNLEKSLLVSFCQRSFPASLVRRSYPPPPPPSPFPFGMSSVKRPSNQ